MYDSDDDYVAQLETATDDAVERGHLLQSDAEDLLERATSASIGIDSVDG
ncbi:alpha/beta hydrolase domain-containing protein [Haloterrigena alkaliphila]